MMFRGALGTWAALACVGVCLGVNSTLSWSWDRPGRLEGDIFLNLTEVSFLRCYTICRNDPMCKGFNRYSDKDICELMATSLCESKYLAVNGNETDWRFYEIWDENEPDVNHPFYSMPMCTEKGLCKSTCSREIGQTCYNDLMCTEKTNHSHCTSNTTEVLGICECDKPYWGYNGSLCVHPTSFDSMTWTWIIKRVVNNMCHVNFTTRASGELKILLANNPDWRVNTYYYYIFIGYDNYYSGLDRYHTRVYTRVTNGIRTKNFQNFTLYWCDGQIRVSAPGWGTFISYNDRYPIPVQSMGFNMPNGNPYSHLFFPHNLVDPYFPTSLETGAVRTNGHHWIQYKLLPDAGFATNISFEFECMAPRDCELLFGYRFDHGRQYRITFGSHDNLMTRLYNGRTGSWVVLKDTPGILSPTEFRRFWINIEGTSVSLGQGDLSNQTDPIITYTDGAESTRTFTHVSVLTCCNNFGYWKFISHPEFHEYPNGAYVL